MNARRLRLSALTRRTPSSLDGNGSPSLPRLRERPVLPRRPFGRGRFESLRSPLPAAGIALVLIALLGYLAVYRAASNRTQVLVATHTLPAGTVLSTGDLRGASIAAEGRLLATLLPASQEPRALGQRLSSTVPAGAPLPAGALAERATQTSAFTLAAPEFDVAGEELQPGDRVSVLVTFGAGSGSATTRPLARGLEVITVGEAPPSSDPSTTTVPVTVALANPVIVSQLALANQDGKLDLLREGTGGSSTAAIPSATAGGGVP